MYFNVNVDFTGSSFGCFNANSVLHIVKEFDDWNFQQHFVEIIFLHTRHMVFHILYICV